MGLFSGDNNIRPYKFSSFSRLISSLEGMRLRHPYSVLSFDVFDTLLFRRCHPQAVVEGAARWLTEECIRLHVRPQQDSLAARAQGYRKVTSANIGRGLDPDCNLKELCRAWVAEIAPDLDEQHPELASRLEAHEVELEKAVCYANAPMVDALRHLKFKGFRLIYVSDMYLGHHVGELLDACGFYGIFDAGYVSGDLAQLKRTGALFRHVLIKENVAATEVLHVGDNPVNDGVRATEQSISAYVVRDRHEVQRYHGLEFDWKYVKRDPHHAGFVAAAFATSTSGEYGSFSESVGTRSLGPIYAAFLHGALRRCAEENIQNVFFVAREGSILKDIFVDLAPLVYRSGSLPNATYIGFSRHTAMLYAMEDMGIREISKIDLNTAHHSLRNVLAPLRLPEGLIRQAAIDCGIDDIDAALPSYYLQWGPFHRVLRHTAIRNHKDELLKRSKRLIGEYLEQRGLFRRHRAAIIDVGWNAQIQENLHLGILDRPDHPQLFGMYMGTMLRAHWTKTPQNWVDAVLADESDAQWHAQAIFEFVPALEACVRAPHGTVVDHKQLPEGEVVPVFKAESELSRQAELNDELTIAQLQAGIRTYAKAYRVAADLFGFGDAQMRPYARSMADRLVRFPTRAEARVFLPINNVSDLGSDVIVSMSDGIAGMPVWKAWLNLHTIIRKSKWRYGVFAALGIPFLQPIYAILSGLRRVPRRGCSLANGDVSSLPLSSCEYRDTIWQGQEDPSQTAPQAYEAEMKVRERNLAQLGREDGPSLALRALTQPLSFREAFPPWFTSVAARAIFQCAHKPSLRMDQMGIKPLFYRAMYSRYPGFTRKVARLTGRERQWRTKRRSGVDQDVRMPDAQQLDW